MGVSCFEPQIEVHSHSKMKAFVAALSSLSAVASGTQIIANAGFAPYGYALAPGYAPGVYTNTAPLTAPAVAPVPAVLAYGHPYDYAGQVYPVAEPYIHEEIPAEEYAHEEVAAEEYVHTEIAAEPYVHSEVAAEPYVHSEIAAEPYVHSEVAAEPYVHQEPVVVAAPAPVAPAPLTYAA